MEKELLELVESEINFHGECSSQMIEELLLFLRIEKILQFISPAQVYMDICE